MNLQNERRKGIQAADVERAADQLLAAGERPTIEKVRAQLGRGSPNTIAPMLDLWFSGLGRRVRGLAGAEGWGDQLPASLLASAEALWRQAQEAASEAAQQTLAPLKDALAAQSQRLEERSQALVQQEALWRERQAGLERSLQAAEQQAAALQGQLALVQQEAHAKAHKIEQLEASLRQAQERREQAEAQHDRELKQLADDRRKAEERYDSAAVRAALEIDRARQEVKAERAGRLAAEKDGKAFESQLQALQQQAQTERTQWEAVQANAQLSWQRERLAAQEQAQLLQSQWLAREAAWLGEIKALKAQVAERSVAQAPVASQSGNQAARRPAAATSPPQSTAPAPRRAPKRSAARPSGAWRLRRQP
ncbi:DNA-binding protein [Curvibacter sp. HBC61]|uniref:DNA-binding protein n=1 Tax=Curvibacter cyanobacteriorum TaxID=3026422 RepID=A0ABT5MUE5_9BURK|nr:DNA-binding protein [Curvibacter sp. HBC61]MDD0837515.1 DNA-binding protein [Curvibacter sp. HBC61]